MSVATAQRWALVEGSCLICESETTVVDTALELAGGARVRVCAACTKALAARHRLESKIADELVAQLKREGAAQEQMLAERDAELGRRGAELEVLRVELEKLRAERDRRRAALDRVVSAAMELT